MVCDRQMDRRTEKVTYRGGCPTKKVVLPLAILDTFKIIDLQLLQFDL